MQGPQIIGKLDSKYRGSERGEKMRSLGKYLMDNFGGELIGSEEAFEALEAGALFAAINTNCGMYFFRKETERYDCKKSRGNKKNTNLSVDARCIERAISIERGRLNDITSRTKDYNTEIKNLDLAHAYSVKSMPGDKNQE
jgi:hypothetical protein